MKTLLKLFVLFSLVFFPARGLFGQPYGLNSRPVGAAFLNHQMPEAVPPVGNYQAVVAFPNLNFYYALGLTPVPGTNRLCVWEREGRIYTFANNPSASTKTLVLDISNQCQGWDASGLLGVEFHPGFATNRFIYLSYTWVPPGTVVGSPTRRPSTIRDGYYHDRLSRFTLDANGVAIPGSELVLIDLTANSVWHKGGGMFFHPQNGFLYVTDGDDQNSPDDAQFINKSLFGGVWRLDVDQRGGSVSHPAPRQPLNGVTANYYIPNDNPFVGQPGVMEEFFAIGLRSPHRMTCDPVTGRIFIGDVGFGTREEVDVIEPGDPPGLNFQWPQAEGNLGTLQPPYVGVSKPPILDYDRTDGAAVIGGYVYRGTNFPALNGKYIFGDNITRNIWALDESASPAQKTLLCVMPRGCCTNDAADHLGLSSFGVDQSGEIYMIQLGETSGRIYKLASTGTAQGYQNFPLLLSQTGAFTNTPNLIPSPVLIPYTVNSPLWSDGAVKRRWMALATNATIRFGPAGEWSFPNGSVFVKHFELPVNDTNTNIVRRLETRFLVRETNGAAYGITYKWRPDNSDADLMVNALSENITITTATGTRVQQWYYPGRADCLRCHTPAAGYVLGVSTRQLNGNLTYPGTGVTDNQLRCWSHIGLFSTNTPVNEAAIPGYAKLAKITDLAAPLEHRVRSYLDVNCSQCHRPGGVQEAVWDARFDTPLASQHIINGAALNALGVTGAKVVVPQDLAHSIMYLRSTNLGAVKMPPLANNVVNTNFVKALAEWIGVVTPPPLSGPVNRWKLDEASGTVAADSAGSAHGVYQSGALLNQPGAAPYTGKSIYVGAANGTATIPALNYNADTLTITVWLKRTGGQAGAAGIIFCRSPKTAAGLNIDAASKLRYSWNDNPQTWGWSSGLGLPEYQWVLAALVIEPNQATMYLRNVEQLYSATNAVPNSAEEFDGPLSFGIDTIDTNRRFAGYLDDVRIYNRALLATEIDRLYAEGFTGSPIIAGLSRQGNILRLNWLGGSPPYQVQSKTNFASPVWQNFGTPINTNSLILTFSNAAAFYRVLGQ